MRLSVKEVAKLANETVKTLHHYHKIGLLVRSEINESGYRSHGQKEIERLQQILFFRELDFSLKDITEALSEQSDRTKVLAGQRNLLITRRKRLDRLIQTVEDSISHAKRSEVMETDKMFAGFSEEEWEEALTKQSDYLKEKYGFDLIQDSPMQADEMNEMAREVIEFQNTLAQALRDGVSHKDEKIKTLLTDHLAFLNSQGPAVDPNSLLENARFLIADDFYRTVMDSMQVGLSYYYLSAVET